MSKAIDLSEVVKFAEFGKAVAALMKEHDLVPKAKTKVKVVRKFVFRRPRRTRAEMQAATPETAA